MIRSHPKISKLKNKQDFPKPLRLKKNRSSPKNWNKLYFFANLIPKDLVEIVVVFLVIGSLVAAHSLFFTNETELIKENTVRPYETLFYTNDWLDYNFINATQDFSRRGNSLGAIWCHGIVVQDSEWTFMVADNLLLYNLTTFTSQIIAFQTHNPSTSYVILELPGFIQSLNLYNGFLYFSHEYGIKRIRTDGSDFEILLQTQDGTYVSEMSLVNDWLYFRRGASQIFKMSIQNPKPELLLEKDGISQTTITNDWIFFSTQNSAIYRMNKDGTNLSRIINGGIVSSFTIIGDWLIYSNYNHALYKMCLTTFHHEFIYQISGLLLGHFNNWIYFSNNRTGFLYRIRINGTNLNHTLSREVTALNMVAGWKFYTTRGLTPTQDGGYVSFPFPYRMCLDSGVSERIRGG